MQLHEVTVGTVLGFLVYHDRTTPITVTANPSDMTEIKTVDKHANATHISIKVIANGSSLVQVLSSDQEFIAFYISTHA